jgi:hypothetical protein
MENHDAFSLKNFKDELEQHAISLAFNGSFSQDTVGLIDINLKNRENAKLLTKRIFGLVVEMAQNIHHYSAKKVYSKKYCRNIGVGVLAISETKDHYVITSGNYISKSDSEEIKNRFEELNELDEDGLKDLYKVRRKMPQRPNKPGANLGFIDMRRKSGNPVDFKIKDESSNNPFFILSAKINK